jgi:hypothetical protein
MKEQPNVLFEKFLEILQTGVPLTDEQVIKMEYLKKLLIKE